MRNQHQLPHRSFGCFAGCRFKQRCLFQSVLIFESFIELAGWWMVKIYCLRQPYNVIVVVSKTVFVGARCGDDVLPCKPTLCYLRISEWIILLLLWKMCWPKKQIRHFRCHCTEAQMSSEAEQVFISMSVVTERVRMDSLLVRSLERSYRNWNIERKYAFIGRETVPCCKKLMRVKL